MTTDGASGRAIRWPEIVYRQVEHNLIACVAETEGYRDVYPSLDRRYHIPEGFPGEVLKTIKALPPRVRRRMERLVAYCPGGCTLLTVYAVNGWLLLKLSGDRLMRDGEYGQVLLSAEKPGRAAYLPHQALWLLNPPEGAWSVGCTHGMHMIEAFKVFTMSCSALVAQRTRKIPGALLAPGDPGL